MGPVLPPHGPQCRDELGLHISPVTEEAVAVAVDEQPREARGILGHDHHDIGLTAIAPDRAVEGHIDGLDGIGQADIVLIGPADHPHAERLAPGCNLPLVGSALARVDRDINKGLDGPATWTRHLDLAEGHGRIDGLGWG